MRRPSPSNWAISHRSAGQRRYTLADMHAPHPGTLQGRVGMTTWWTRPDHRTSSVSVCALLPARGFTDGDATCVGCAVDVVGRRGTACAGGGTDCCPVKAMPHIHYRISHQVDLPSHRRGKPQGAEWPHASQNFLISVSVPQLVQACCAFLTLTASTTPSHLQISGIKAFSEPIVRLVPGVIGFLAFACCCQRPSETCGGS